MMRKALVFALALLAGTAFSQNLDVQKLNANDTLFVNKVVKWPDGTYQSSASTSTFKGAQKTGDALITDTVKVTGDGFVKITQSGKTWTFSLQDTVRIYINATVHRQLMLLNDTTLSNAPLESWGIDLDSSSYVTTQKIPLFTTWGDTVVLDTVKCVGTSTANLTFQIKWASDVTAGGDSLFSSAQTFNSSTTGNKFSTFYHTDIPPGNFVWIEPRTLTTKPKIWSLFFVRHYK